jgi:hypothetical protein
VLIQLEEKSRDVLGEGWMAKFDDRFVESLGKYRKVRSLSLSRRFFLFLSLLMNTSSLGFCMCSTGPGL